MTTIQSHNCNKCGIPKPLTTEFFYEHKAGSGRFTKICKECKKTLVREHSHTYAGKLSDIRSRSKNELPAGLHEQFDLTEDSLAEFEGDNCTYCDDPIRAGQLDRTDNTKGYARGNCIPCCFPCNCMKGDGTEEAFLRRVYRIVRNFDEP